MIPMGLTLSIVTSASRENPVSPAIIMGMGGRAWAEVERTEKAIKAIVDFIESSDTN
jgi:hypothetical protein